MDAKTALEAYHAANQTHREAISDYQREVEAMLRRMREFEQEYLERARDALEQLKGTLKQDIRPLIPTLEVQGQLEEFQQASWGPLPNLPKSLDHWLLPLLPAIALTECNFYEELRYDDGESYYEDCVNLTFRIGSTTVHYVGDYEEDPLDMADRMLDDDSFEALYYCLEAHEDQLREGLKQHPLEVAFLMDQGENSLAGVLYGQAREELIFTACWIMDLYQETPEPIPLSVT